MRPLRADARALDPHPSVPRVVIVGLGPAGVGYVSEGARRALNEAPLVLLRTSRHEAAAEFIANGARSLDHHYEGADHFSDVYRAIAEEVVAAAVVHGSVAYGVPGSPFICERSVELLREDPRVACEVVPGMSFLDLCWERLGIDPIAAHVRLVDASSFPTDAAGDAGPFLVAQVYSQAVASALKLALDEVDNAEVTLLSHLGHDDEIVAQVPLEDLDRSIAFDHLSAIYIPALKVPVAGALVEAIEIVSTLRERCPWDKEQTHESLSRHLLEEAYEAIDAIEDLGSDPDIAKAAHLEEELGDVLCQVLFHARLATEEGLFSLADVCRTLTEKLVHRHPHVFGEVTDVTTADSVVERWEQIKQEEKGRESLMDGIPSSLPALLYATKLERKAGGVGLGASSQIDRADLETTAADPKDEAALGEVLFGLARRAAANGVDPEAALRGAARRFEARFVRAERAARVVGTPFSELSDDARRELFDEAEEGSEHLRR